MSFNGIGCISIVRYREDFVGVKCAKGGGIIFPGGKREVEETFQETAARELFEETGLVAIRQQLVMHAMSTDGYYVYAFETEVSEFFIGYKTAEGESVIATWDDLLLSEFKPYYTLLREVLPKALPHES